MLINRTNFATILAAACLFCLPAGCGTNTKKEPSQPTQETPIDYLRSIEARADDGLYNAVIEIPAGYSKKYETNKKTGAIEWSLDDAGQPRTIQYLPYPANYGMIPGTWLPPGQGGDNDPLDVFVLGEATPHKAIVPVRIIGAIRLLDRGEHDDKLLAVEPNGIFSEATDLSSLDSLFPGVIVQLENWLTHYKGAGKTELHGRADREEAEAILEAAIAAFPDFPLK